MPMVILPLVFVLAQTPATAPAPTASPAAPANARQGRPPASGDAQKPRGGVDLETLRQQVMLDRAGFSPGPIDARGGTNTAKALAASGGATAVASVEPVIGYRITTEDAAGPFADVPEDMMEKSKLPALGYASMLEALAERFHATPALLQQLNPGAAFAADEEIQVPNVDPMVLPAPVATPSDPATPAAAKPSAPSPPKPDVVVTVSKSERALSVTDASGRTMFYAPVTTGSEHDPLPIGEWKVNGVQRDPTFHYNPELFWDADPTHAKAKIPAGPNNPVGVVWIDISKEHYGLHGTPVPQTIGRTESHGCVRLTNWDALRLAAMVKPGTRVVFKE